MRYRHKLQTYAFAITTIVLLGFSFSTANLVRRLLINRQIEFEESASAQFGTYFGTLFENVGGWVQVLKNTPQIRDSIVNQYDSGDFRRITSIISATDRSIGSVVADTRHIEKIYLLGENQLAYVRDFNLAEGYYLGNGVDLGALVDDPVTAPLVKHSARPFHYRPADARIGPISVPAEFVREISERIVYTDSIRGQQNTVRGLVVVLLETDTLTRLLSQDGKERELFLTDDAGSLVWATTPNVLQGDTPIELDEGASQVVRSDTGRPYLQTVHLLDPHRFYLVKRIPLDQVLNGMPRVRWTMILGGAICLVLVAILAGFLSRQYAEPLEQMVEQLRRTRPGHADARKLISSIPMRRLALSKKLILFFVVSVGLPNLVFVSSVLYASYETYSQKLVKLTQATMSHVRWNLEYQLESYDDLSRQLSYMDQVQIGLRSPPGDSSPEERVALERTLTAVKLAKRDVRSAGFFYSDGKPLVVNDYLGNAIEPSLSPSARETIVAGNDDLVLIRNDQTRHGAAVISFGRTIRSTYETDFGSRIGFSVVSLDRSALDTLLSTTLGVTGLQLSVEDATGQLVASGNMLQRATGNDDSAEFRVPLDTGHLELVGSMNQAALTVGLYPLFWYSTILLVVYLIAIVSFTAAVASVIAKPIVRLKIMLENVGLGDADEPVLGRHSDEISILAHEYNRLISRLDSLIYENYQVRLRESELLVLEKEAQLTALQQQINPHFLYNTLESIKWIAYQKDDLAVCEMASALGTFFRGAVSGSNELVTLQEELSHLESYTYIQRIRYNYSFSVDVEVNDEIRQLMTVKLILQPLVENALLHGLQDIARDGHIWIRAARVNEQLRIEVGDNGVGMGPARLQKLRSDMDGLSSTETSPSIGLANVYQRLRLRFEENCTVDVQSEQGVGTTITLYVPAITPQADAELSLNSRHGYALDEVSLRDRE